jgi:hypothetical protein
LKAYLEKVEQNRKEINDRLRKNRLENPNAEERGRIMCEDFPCCGHDHGGCPRRKN